jgi:hypothetical protein
MPITITTIIAITAITGGKGSRKAMIGVGWGITPHPIRDHFDPTQYLSDRLTMM